MESGGAVGAGTSRCTLGLCPPPGSEAEFFSPGNAHITPTTEAANWLVSLYLYRVRCQQQSFGEATDRCYLK